MVKDIDLLNAVDKNNINNNAALVWVIDGDCLYDIPTSKQYADMFLNFDEIIDVTSEYNINEGLVVRFIKNNEIVEDLETSEYFGSILLSNPLVLDLFAYPYGSYVVSPYAKFDGEKFIILNQNMDDLAPWIE